LKEDRVEQHSQTTEAEAAACFFSKDEEYQRLKTLTLLLWEDACEKTGIDKEGLFVFPGGTEKHEWWNKYETAKQEFVSYTKQKLSLISESDKAVLSLIGIKQDG